jgi:hypothetical protein
MSTTKNQLLVRKTIDLKIKNKASSDDSTSSYETNQAPDTKSSTSTKKPIKNSGMSTNSLSYSSSDSSENDSIGSNTSKFSLRPSATIQR